MFTSIYMFRKLNGNWSKKIKTKSKNTIKISLINKNLSALRAENSPSEDVYKEKNKIKLTGHGQHILNRNSK